MTGILLNLAVAGIGMAQKVNADTAGLVLMAELFLRTDFIMKSTGALFLKGLSLIIYAAIIRA